MINAENEQTVINKLLNWAEKKASIRAMLLTSSRANPHTPTDNFSDYDIILVVTDIQPFLRDESWLEDFGRVLTVYRDPVCLEQGFEKFIRVTQYEDGTKIDYSVWPVELLKRVAEEPELSDYLNDGYQIIMDRDTLTAGLKSPTYKAYIPDIPTEDEYLTVIENFFSNSSYVAKHICRDDLMPLKYCLDETMKLNNLRKMLEWRLEIDNDWSVKAGAYGKGLKKKTIPELWAELEKTYVGAGREENWEALFKTIELFCKVAREVGSNLGYTYPQDLERRVVKYLRNVREIDNNLKTS